MKHGSPLASMARQGVGTDTMVGHLTPGEVVIPRKVTAEDSVMRKLKEAFEANGLNFQQYIVGSDANRPNPHTGAPMFEGGEGEGGEGEGGEGQSGGGGGAGMGAEGGTAHGGEGQTGGGAGMGAEGGTAHGGEGQTGEGQAGEGQTGEGQTGEGEGEKGEGDDAPADTGRDPNAAVSQIGGGPNATPGIGPGSNDEAAANIANTSGGPDQAMANAIGTGNPDIAAAVAGMLGLGGTSESDSDTEADAANMPSKNAQEVAFVNPEAIQVEFGPAFAINDVSAPPGPQIGVGSIGGNAIGNFGMGGAQGVAPGAIGMGGQMTGQESFGTETGMGQGYGSASSAAANAAAEAAAAVGGSGGGSGGTASGSGTGGGVGGAGAGGSDTGGPVGGPSGGESGGSGGSADITIGGNFSDPAARAKVEAANMARANAIDAALNSGASNAAAKQAGIDAFNAVMGAQPARSFPGYMTTQQVANIVTGQQQAQPTMEAPSAKPAPSPLNLIAQNVPIPLPRPTDLDDVTEGTGTQATGPATSPNKTTGGNKAGSGTTGGNVGSATGSTAGTSASGAATAGAQPGSAFSNAVKNILSPGNLLTVGINAGTSALLGPLAVPLQIASYIGTGQSIGGVGSAGLLGGNMTPGGVLGGGPTAGYGVGPSNPNYGWASGGGEGGGIGTGSGGFSGPGGITTGTTGGGSIPTATGSGQYATGFGRTFQGLPDNFTQYGYGPQYTFYAAKGGRVAGPLSRMRRG